MRNSGWEEVSERAATDPRAQRGAVPYAHALTSALGRQVSELRAAASAGSGSFSFSVPVASYPGRGESTIGLTLTYNSRIWQKVLTASGAEKMVYDIDNDWPAPGWRFSFERMVSTRDEPIFVGVDGTRHPARVTAAENRPNGIRVVEQVTTDGSLIRFVRERGPTVHTGWALYPNGSRVEFTALSDDRRVLFPTAYVDRHGNTTRVAYRGGTGPDIETVTDPTGRNVRFIYDAAGRLITVTGPSCYMGPDIVLLRLHHGTITTSMSWDPNLVVNPPGQMPVIDAVMTPPTGSGYWFADSGDYSGYGMIRNVRECTGMTWIADPANPQGTITRGAEARLRVYRWPLGSGPTQNDAPKYTHMDETVAGRDGPPGRTQYAVAPWGADGTEVTITLPDGSRTVKQDQRAAGASGLLSHLVTYDETNRKLQATDTVWEAGTDGAPRVRIVTHTTGVGAAMTEFRYGPVNNQVVEKIEHHPGGGIARRTTTEYFPDPEYRGRHILNVPSRVRVFDGDGSALSRTDIVYDTGTLRPTPGITGFEERFDPFSPIYDPATASRALPTLVFRFLDPAAPNGETVITTMEYDLAGNLVVSDLGAQRVSTTYDSSTDYALPTRVDIGSRDPASPIRLITSATYNPAGRLSGSTDFAGNWTEYNYIPEGFRLGLTYHQSEPYFEQHVTYNDAERKQTTYVLDDNGDTVSTVVRTFDGLGRVAKIESANAEGGWDIVESHSDSSGRVRRTSAPYRAGDSVAYGTERYDPLGRIISRTSPDGESSTSWAYDVAPPGARHHGDTFHSTVRVTDAWGRQRWAAHDVLGRIRSVAEPTADGDGTVLPGRPTIDTDYWYVGLTTAIYVNLALPNGPNRYDQMRRMRTDGLGRTIAQALPERDATLTMPNPMNFTWSDLYTYDHRGNLVSHTDPRGVVAHYYYNDDPLDRLQMMICNADGATDTDHPIAEHPFEPPWDPADRSLRFDFTYETEGDLRRVATQSGGDLTETYTYDSVGVSSETVAWTALPNGPLITSYERGSLGRVTKVTGPARWRHPGEHRPVQEYVYGMGSVITSVLLDGTAIASGCYYDAAGRVRTLTLGEPGAGQTVEHYAWDPWHGWLDHQSLTRDGTILLDLWYSYDRRPPHPASGKTGQVTATTSAAAPTATTTYDYDQLGRLHQAAHGAAGWSTPDWTQTYDYDLFGNRTGVSATGTDTQGNPMEADGQTLPADPFTNHVDAPGWDYDAAGNLAARPDPVTGEPIRYAYDAAGRLATISDGAGNVLLEHLYGVCHRRRGTWYADTCDTVLYAWEGDNVTGQYTAEQIGHGGERGVDGKPLWFVGGHFLGTRQLVTQYPDRATAQLHPGRTGTRFVSTSEGTPTADASVSWLPFGSRRLEQGAEAPVLGSAFVGYGAVDHGLAYAQHRFYDPQLGRFITPDPLGVTGLRAGSSQSFNGYAYVGGDPVNNIDPLGLDPVCIPDPNRELGVKCWNPETNTWEPTTLTAPEEILKYEPLPSLPADRQTKGKASPQGPNSLNPTGGTSTGKDTATGCKRTSSQPSASWDEIGKTARDMAIAVITAVGLAARPTEIRGLMGIAGEMPAKLLLLGAAGAEGAGVGAAVYGAAGAGAGLIAAGGAGYGIGTLLDQGYTALRGQTLGDDLYDLFGDDPDC